MQNGQVRRVGSGDSHRPQTPLHPHGFLFCVTVVQARVPYREGDESKVRPALVLGCHGDVVVLRVFTSKERNAQRRGGGVEVYHNGLRCWVVNEAIELDRRDIVQVTAQRYDELAFATAA